MIDDDTELLDILKNVDDSNKRVITLTRKLTDLVTEKTKLEEEIAALRAHSSDNTLPDR